MAATGNISSGFPKVVPKGVRVELDMGGIPDELLPSLKDSKPFEALRHLEEAGVFDPKAWEEELKKEESELDEKDDRLKEVCTGLAILSAYYISKGGGTSISIGGSTLKPEDIPEVEEHLLVHVTGVCGGDIMSEGLVVPSDREEFCRQYEHLKSLLSADELGNRMLSFLEKDIQEGRIQVTGVKWDDEGKRVHLSDGSVLTVKEADGGSSILLPKVLQDEDVDIISEVSISGSSNEGLLNGLNGLVSQFESEHLEGFDEVLGQLKGGEAEGRIIRAYKNALMIAGSEGREALNNSKLIQLCNCVGGRSDVIPDFLDSVAREQLPKEIELLLDDEVLEGMGHKVYRMDEYLNTIINSTDPDLRKFLLNPETVKTLFVEEEGESMRHYFSKLRGAGELQPEVKDFLLTPTVVSCFSRMFTDHSEEYLEALTRETTSPKLREFLLNPETAEFCTPYRHSTLNKVFDGESSEETLSLLLDLTAAERELREISYNRPHILGIVVDEGIPLENRRRIVDNICLVNSSRASSREKYLESVCAGDFEGVALMEERASDPWVKDLLNRVESKTSRNHLSGLLYADYVDLTDEGVKRVIDSMTPSQVSDYLHALYNERDSTKERRESVVMLLTNEEAMKQLTTLDDERFRIILHQWREFSSIDYLYKLVQAKVLSPETVPTIVGVANKIPVNALADALSPSSSNVDEDAADIMVGHARDTQNVAGRKYLIGRLGQINNSKCVAALDEIVKGKNHVEVRQWAVDALIDNAVDFEGSIAGESVRKILGCSDNSIRYQAFTNLAERVIHARQYGLSFERLEELSERIHPNISSEFIKFARKGEDADIRLKAIDVLKNASSMEVLTAMEDLAYDDSESMELRRDAALTLADNAFSLGISSDINVLLEGLGKRGDYTRASVILDLGDKLRLSNFETAGAGVQEKILRGLLRPFPTVGSKKMAKYATQLSSVNPVASRAYLSAISGVYLPASMTPLEVPQRKVNNILRNSEFMAKYMQLAEKCTPACKVVLDKAVRAPNEALELLDSLLENPTVNGFVRGEQEYGGPMEASVGSIMNSSRSLAMKLLATDEGEAILGSERIKAILGPELVSRINAIRKGVSVDGTDLELAKSIFSDFKADEGYFACRRATYFREGYTGDYTRRTGSSYTESQMLAAREVIINRGFTMLCHGTTPEGEEAIAEGLEGVKILFGKGSPGAFSTLDVETARHYSSGEGSVGFVMLMRDALRESGVCIEPSYWMGEWRDVRLVDKNGILVRAPARAVLRLNPATFDDVYTELAELLKTREAMSEVEGEVLERFKAYLGKQEGFGEHSKKIVSQLRTLGYPEPKIVEVLDSYVRYTLLQDDPSQRKRKTILETVLDAGPREGLDAAIISDYLMRYAGLRDPDGREYIEQLTEEHITDISKLERTIQAFILREQRKTARKQGQEAMDEFNAGAEQIGRGDLKIGPIEINNILMGETRRRKHDQIMAETKDVVRKVSELRWEHLARISKAVMADLETSDVAKPPEGSFTVAMTSSTARKEAIFKSDYDLLVLVDSDETRERYEAYFNSLVPRIASQLGELGYKADIGEMHQVGSTITVDDLEAPIEGVLKWKKQGRRIDTFERMKQNVEPTAILDLQGVAGNMGLVTKFKETMLGKLESEKRSILQYLGSDLNNYRKFFHESGSQMLNGDPPPDIKVGLTRIIPFECYYLIAEHAGEIEKYLISQGRSAGELPNTTLERLELLRDAGVISGGECNGLSDAFTDIMLWRMRVGIMHGPAKEVEVDPMLFTNLERGRLMDNVSAIREFGATRGLELGETVIEGTPKIYA